MSLLRKHIDNNGPYLIDLIDFCMDYGFVFIDKQLVIIAYRASSSDIAKGKNKVDINGDTWFINYLSGDVKRSFNFIGDAKYVAFERYDGNIRLYSADILRRRFNG